MESPRLAHTIRLQSAWEPPGEKETAWTRRFGRPAVVDPGERVWLVISGPRVASSVALNGTDLPALAGEPRWACDISSLLRDRNVLEIRPGLIREWEPGTGNGMRQPLPATVGVVVLEIITGQAARAPASTTGAPRRA
jgi:hypothetical protein